ncbi:nicotinamide riboside transporter PnuC [Aliiglaciecola sp. CAU 1673]|uniref:nicotinamide riboside transporter PnuC n=1 Tax=Aliiglaciecola sp. CAU 1673 TaxID=3032595 RepID=UPI0023DBDD22|nr:nicotinamide riboside transporter PnuC [Aliiglaciecola sp. CAU 1673]MDF2180079.1 nicotinamide riboside transporter PnuC [Aliiglaciecola sp. CAU 1673]
MTLLETLAQQWASQSPWEVVAVILALAYVWLAARQHIACWACALVSTAIYTWLFWEHALPLQSLLNLYYLMMALYGWWHWNAMAEQHEDKVQVRGIGFHLPAIVGLCFVSWSLAAGMEGMFNSQYLHLDALVTVFSLFTTYLVTQKVLENWLYWIVIDAAAAYLYWQSGLYLTGLLFVGYLGFALYGFLKWRTAMQQQGALDAA